eukprot:3540632-Pleurochrysis_carterae.AAC.1
MVTTPVPRVHAADDQPGKNVDIDVRSSGDFQIPKALNNMLPYASAIWCECEGAALRSFTFAPLASWADVLARSADNGAAPCRIK